MSHERCCSETQVAHGTFLPPRRNPQAQPLGPASRNSPNGCQKHRDTSAPHTRPSSATKRRRWPPSPVHCSTQPPPRASMLPPRSPDTTRLACSGVKFPPRAHPERLKGARQPLPAEEETSATSFTACKSCISSPARRLRAAYARQSAQTLPIVKHLSPEYTFPHHEISVSKNRHL